MTNIYIITNDRWIIPAADVHTAIILNIRSFTNSDKIVVAAQRNLMPNAAIWADTNRPNNCYCFGNVGSVVNFWIVI